MQAPIPVTLLSGFLGAGKTTLLKRIVENSGNFRVAVVVNDVAALNIDSSLVRNTRALGSSEQVLELQNGCVCCTLRADLVKAIADLASKRAFDAIVVESSGVAEPSQVAETFGIDVSSAHRDSADAKEKKELAAAVRSLRGASALQEVARLDTCVTVVDAGAFNGDLASAADLVERFGTRDAGGEAGEEDGERNVSTLLVHQIEFADLIVLNKCDLASRSDVLAIKNALATLNPGAEIVCAIRSDVPLNKLLATNRFDLNKAANAAGWLQTLRGGGKVVETREYGICNFVYTSRTPFHPTRLRMFLDDFAAVLDLAAAAAAADDDDDDDDDDAMDAGMPMSTDDDGDDPREAETREKAKAEAAEKLAISRQKYGHVFRSKGFVWIAGRDEVCGEWGHAGAVLQLDCGGPWMGMLPQDMWPEEGSEERDMLLRDFANPVVMDRRQELVFIGRHMNKTAITAALERCLVTRAESSSARPAGASIGGRIDEWKLGLTSLSAEAEAVGAFPAWPTLAELFPAEGGDDDGHGHGRESGHRHHHH